MNILLATDGSESARTAGRLLTTLPLPQDSRITVLSAIPAHRWVESPRDSAISVYPWLVDLFAEEEGAAHRAAEITSAHLRESGVAATVVIRRQSPTSAILEQAEAAGTDLIMVGSHGTGAVERYLVGSVSERVARYAHCSVLVARGDSPHRVIVAVDESQASERALDVLARFPLPAETEVTVLHVLDLPHLHHLLRRLPTLNSEAVIDQCNRESHVVGSRILCEAQARLGAAGRSADTDLRVGNPTEQIVAAAWEKEADLIIMGAENRSGVGRRFLGCVAACILAHAPCSVLVAR